MPRHLQVLPRAHHQDSHACRARADHPVTVAAQSIDGDAQRPQSTDQLCDQRRLVSRDTTGQHNGVIGPQRASRRASSVRAASTDTESTVVDANSTPSSTMASFTLDDPGFTVATRIVAPLDRRIGATMLVSPTGREWPPTRLWMALGTTF
ncbi:MAG TPA: hypothetical protein VFX16_04850 [Pseudonocardiaceae bacterium]|nr:hypothetical protein [Pseudonocardiaceae bacterium]